MAQIAITPYTEGSGPYLDALKGAPIVMAAGGTGGHLFPAQALAEALTAQGAELVLVTDQRGRTYTDAFPDVRVMMVDAATFAGRGPVGKLRAGLSILSGVGSAWARLGRIKPAAVIGFGGYPSLPAMAGAVLRGIPTVIHEQNAVLGRVNRLMAGRVSAVACAFDGLRGGGAALAKRAITTGNPVREVITAHRRSGYTPPHADEPVNLLVFGGSQGARVMGQVVPPALAALPQDLRGRLRVTQQCRQEDQGTVEAAYEAAGIQAELAPFFGDMDRRLAEAHLVIARAGASTVTELAVVGRPSILVPLPGAMDDHQTYNANVLTQVDGAWAMPEKEFTPEALAQRLEALLADPDRLAAAAAAAHGAGRPDATARLVHIVSQLAAASRAKSKGLTVPRPAD